MYQSECAIKNTTDAKSYVTYLCIYLKKDVNGNLTTKQLFVKCDGFNFSSVSFACVAIYHQYLLIGILPLSLLVMQEHDLHMNDNIISKTRQATIKEADGTRISRTSIKKIFTQVLWSKLSYF